jgi:hypothetical protein
MSGSQHQGSVDVHVIECVLNANRRSSLSLAGYPPTSSSVEKAIHGFFNIATRKTRFSIGSHFQWLAAIENGGTSLYRSQQVEKPGFSTSC